MEYTPFSFFSLAPWYFYTIIVVLWSFLLYIDIIETGSAFFGFIIGAIFVSVISLLAYAGVHNHYEHIIRDQLEEHYGIHFSVDSKDFPTSRSDDPVKAEFKTDNDEIYRNCEIVPDRFVHKMTIVCDGEPFEPVRALNEN